MPPAVARKRFPEQSPPKRAASTGYNPTMQLGGLPGGDLVEKGLRDLADGRESPEALLVAIGGPRLRRLGFDVPTLDAPEHALYEMLSQSGSDDAHSRYNALIRRLVSFERAAECVG
jgi:hypothetical protein